MIYRLLACLLSVVVLSSCGGGGSGGPASASPPTSPPVAPPPVPPTPPPVLPPAAQLTSTCPVANASTVGVNSWISASFDKNIDPASINQNSVSLDCGGIVISGQASVTANNIYFSPSQSIPSSQTCAVLLDSSIKDIGGVEIGSIAWSFQSGNKEATSFRFDAPRSLVNNSGALLKKVVSEGNDIAVLWISGAGLYVTSSRDGGQTFTTSQPIAVLNGIGGQGIEELDALISNGVLHIAWRVLPPNVNAEILYTHTTTDFVTFSAPLMLTNPNDTRNAFSPTLTVNTSGELHIAWNEICMDGVFCDNNTLGIYSVISTDGGASFAPVVKLASYLTKLPQLAIADNQTLLALTENDILKLFEIAPVTRLLASFSETGAQIWPYQLEEGSGDNLFISWKEGHGIGIQSFYLSNYSSRLLMATPPQMVAQETTTEPYLCNQISPASDSVIHMMTGAYDSGFTQGRREISTSTDGGNTFLYPQPLGFFLTAHRLTNMLTDSECPSIIPRQNGDVILAWERFFQGTPGDWNLMVSNGTASAPCSSP